MALTPEQLAALAASGRDPSQREQIIASASLKASPYAVKNWLDYGSGSAKGYAGDEVPLYEGHQYTLVDNKTGEVLAQGSTPEEIQKIQSIVSDKFASQGRKADWRLYDATPQAGLTSMHERMRDPYLNFSTPGDARGVVVAGNTPDASTLENIGKAVGTALPLAVSFIPGVSELSRALQVAVGAGAGGAGAGLRGDNILSGALMGGLSSAGGQYLGPVLKNADIGLTKAAASALGTGAGATAGGLLTGQSLTNSLMGGVAAGGLSYLGGEVQNALKGPIGGSADVGSTSGGGSDALPSDIVVTGTRAPVSVTAPVTTSNAKAPSDEIVVTGTRTATPSITSPFAVDTGVQNLIDQYAVKPADKTVEQEQQAEQQTEQQTEPDMAQDEIVVTGTGTTTPSITSPFAVDTGTQNLIDQYAVKDTDKTVEQEEPDTAKDELVITAKDQLPFVAPATNLFNNVQYDGGENVRDTQTTEDTAEDQTEDTAKDEIVVTGTGTATPSITSPFAVDTGVQNLIDDYAVKDPAETTDDTTDDTAKDEIIVTGDNTPSVNMAGIGDLINSDDFQKTVAEEEANTKKKSTTDKISDYLRLLGLGVGLIGNIGGGGGGGAGTGRYNTGKGALNPIFSAKLPTPGTEGAFTVGGLGGTAADRTFAARPDTDWYRYGMGPAMDIPAGTDMSNATSPYAGYGPGTLGDETFKQVTGMSHGGPMGYSRGSSRESFAVEGPGTGRSDDIPAVLSDGEYVIDAETVALLGDGSSRAGAKKLDELRVKVRKHKGKNLAQGKFSVNAKHPEAYMLGGRI